MPRNSGPRRMASQMLLATSLTTLVVQGRNLRAGSQIAIRSCRGRRPRHWAGGKPILETHAATIEARSACASAPSAWRNAFPVVARIEGRVATLLQCVRLDPVLATPGVTNAVTRALARTSVSPAVRSCVTLEYCRTDRQSGRIRPCAISPRDHTRTPSSPVQIRFAARATLP